MEVGEIGGTGQVLRGGAWLEEAPIVGIDEPTGEGVPLVA